MKTQTRLTVSHPFTPFLGDTPKILILGSFPSVKSREEGFYYGNPQNRFWKVLARLSGETVPASIPEKKAFLSRNHIALWDVIASCEVVGSSDSSIKNAVPNDIAAITRKTGITRIFCNGKTAKKLYDTYIFPECRTEAVLLPSTSPANAVWSEEKLLSAWREAIFQYKTNQ